MNLQEQLRYIETHLPEAWQYLHEVSEGKAELPKFDDNDDVIHYWGGTLSNQKEEN